MEITENEYILGVWFANNPEIGNIMLTVYKKDLIDGEWLLETRFRWYKDNKAFNSNDIKKSSTMMLNKNTSEEEIEVKNDIFLKCCKAMGFEETYYVPVKGGGKKLVRLLKAQPWAHISVLEEPEKGEGDNGRGKG